MQLDIGEWNHKGWWVCFICVPEKEICSAFPRTERVCKNRLKRRIRPVRNLCSLREIRNHEQGSPRQLLSTYELLSDCTSVHVYMYVGACTVHWTEGSIETSYSHSTLALKHYTPVRTYAYEIKIYIHELRSTRPQSSRRQSDGWSESCRVRNRTLRCGLQSGKLLSFICNSCINLSQHNA